ncbi:MAG: hypothetical protein ABEJ89_07040 [Haloarculaceae archaeon]
MTNAGLWVAFAILFAVVVAASLLPVTPLVGVFPLWAVVVLAAVVATVAVSVAAVRAGWPGVSEA